MDEKKGYIGYIKLFRQTLGSDIAEQNDSVFAAFIKILLMADGNGEFCASVKKLSALLRHGSRNTTYAILACLEKCKVVNIERQAKGLKIIIPNWHIYQQKNSFVSVQKVNTECAKTEHTKTGDVLKNCTHSVQKVNTECAKTEHTKDPAHNKVPVVLNVKELKNIRINNNNYMRDFQTFWDIYPKKSGKQECLNWWKVNCEKIEVPKIMEGLAWYVKSDRVLRGFCLDPIRFLKRAIWNDDPAAYQDKFKRGANLPTPAGKYDV